MPFIIAYQLTRRFKSIRHIFKHVFETTYALRNYRILLYNLLRIANAWQTYRILSSFGWIIFIYSFTRISWTKQELFFLSTFKQFGFLNIKNKCFEFYFVQIKKGLLLFSLKIFYFYALENKWCYKYFLLTMSICLFHNSFIKLHKSLWDKLMYASHKPLQFMSE